MSDRTKRIQIRVSEDTFQRLDVLSKNLGMAPATLASYALSEFLVRKEAERRAFERITEHTGDGVVSTVRELLKISEH